MLSHVNDLLASLPASPQEWWALLWPAATIALLRIGDVTVNVFKVTCIVNGKRLAGAAFAALEAAIWLSAAGIVFSNLTLDRAMGFVLGVAAGTWIGMLVVDRAKVGLVTVRIFVSAAAGRELAGHIIAERLRREGHGATLFNGWGQRGEVHMILSVVKRRVASKVVALVERTDPNAFVALDNEPVANSVAGAARARVSQAANSKGGARPGAPLVLRSVAAIRGCA
jgi:uncharacterized protein YebE (UPF0316 family)